MNPAEKLAKRIIANYNNKLQSNTIDLPAHVESLLQDLGATTSDSGGKVTYYGSDPITPDRLSYGAISAISLAAKAILIAKIWKERTGEGQDIHVDVRKALRRLTPFLDGKWELVNGFPGRTDAHSPFLGGPDIVPHQGTASGSCLPMYFPLYASTHSICLNPRVAITKRYATR